jgi:hypothetical protein
LIQQDFFQLVEAIDCIWWIKVFFSHGCGMYHFTGWLFHRILCLNHLLLQRIFCRMNILQKVVVTVIFPTIRSNTINFPLIKKNKKIKKTWFNKYINNSFVYPKERKIKNSTSSAKYPLVKWPFGEMTIWWYVHSVKWYFTKWHFGETASAK